MDPSAQELNDIKKRISDIMADVLKEQGELDEIINSSVGSNNSILSRCQAVPRAQGGDDPKLRLNLWRKKRRTISADERKRKEVLGVCSRRFTNYRNE